jgi:hypothetical protein
LAGANSRSFSATFTCPLPGSATFQAFAAPGALATHTPIFPADSPDFIITLDPCLIIYLLLYPFLGAIDINFYIIMTEHYSFVNMDPAPDNYFKSSTATNILRENLREAERHI